jgi:hypothetical protein
LDRHAIFIDVGYVLASVAELIVGTPERHLVRCGFRNLVEELVADVGRGTTLPLLRTYWYDASLSGQPEHDQETVADLHGVRLRLGRLVRGEQKGVDSRLVRDLIVLARDRAIAEAHLLAGDEDLCEGVREAQDHGVRVVLIGVPGVNQSRLLVQHADARRELPEAFWRKHFLATEQRPALVQVAGPSTPLAASSLPDAVPRPEPAPPVNPAMRVAFIEAAGRDQSSAVATLMDNIAAETQDYLGRAAEAGRTFARELLDHATPPEIDRLLGLTGWQVPAELDRQLLRRADDLLSGVLWERSELKPAVRNGFWEEFRREAPKKIRS